MKQSILVLLFVATSMTFGFAQVKTPQASPSVKIEQGFGLTTVTLEYSRPGVKKRTVFGDLVPYDKVWRTGANKNTMITFSEATSFGGTEVEAGTYALFATPGKQMWDVYLYTDTENWGTPENWDDSKVAAKTTVKASMNASSVETMYIGLENIGESNADLVISWANSSISVPLATNTVEMALASIDKVMAGPSAGDLYSAARYYRENGKDLNKALEWMTSAVSQRGEKYWNTRQLALIHADLGDYKSAIATAEKSLMLAKEADSAGYISANEASIAEWKKMSMKK